MSKKIHPGHMLEAMLNPSDIPIIDPKGMEEHRLKEELGQKAAQIQEVTVIAREIIKYQNVDAQTALDRAKEFVPLVSDYVTSEIEKLQTLEERRKLTTGVN